MKPGKNNQICACGTVAAHWKYNEAVCERCYRIEAQRSLREDRPKPAPKISNLELAALRDIRRAFPEWLSRRGLPEIPAFNAYAKPL